MKKFRWFTKRSGLIIGIAVSLALLASQVGVIVNPVEESARLATLTVGQHEVVLTVGTTAHAAGVADYTCDGTADDVQLQAALDALPANGGGIVVLAGTYSLSAGVTRAIDNVTITEAGRATILNRDASNLIFTAGGNNWTFRDFATDAGSISVGGNTGWTFQNVLLGANYVAYRISVDNDLGNVDWRARTFTSDVAGGTAPFNVTSTTTVTNLSSDLSDGYQAVRGATYVVTANDSVASSKAQADYVCDGTADDVQFQAAVDALPAGGGKVVALGGDYNFTATVARAIDNVTIEGAGYSSYFANNNATNLFSAGAQSNWVFRDIRTDTGGVNVAGSSDWWMTNVWEGASYTSINGDVLTLPAVTFVGVVNIDSLNDLPSGYATAQGVLNIQTGIPTSGDHYPLTIWGDSTHGYAFIEFRPERRTGIDQADAIITAHKLNAADNSTHRHLSIYTSNAGGASTKRIDLNYLTDTPDFQFIEIDALHFPSRQARLSTDEPGMVFHLDRDNDGTGEYIRVLKNGTDLIFQIDESGNIVTLGSIAAHTLAGNLGIGGYAFDAGSGDVKIITTGNLKGLVIESTQDAAVGTALRFNHYRANPTDNDYAGLLEFFAYNDKVGPEQIRYGQFFCRTTDVSDGVEAGSFLWYLANAPSINLAMELSGAGTGWFDENLLVDEFIQVTEMVAPGAGASNTARVYAVAGGDNLTDLCAVFQDGTVDIFAQETTELDAPIFTYPSGTELIVEMRKPHPGLIIFVAVYPDGSEFVLREIEYHDAAKIAASLGAEGVLPYGWEVTTLEQRVNAQLAEIGTQLQEAQSSLTEVRWRISELENLETLIATQISDLISLKNKETLLVEEIAVLTNKRATGEARLLEK